MAQHVASVILDCRVLPHCLKGVCRCWHIGLMWRRMLKLSLPMQVRVINLQGKNYVFTLAPTFYPIAEVGCTAAASKTRKNIIITLQVRPCACSSLEEHHLP